MNGSGCYTALYFYIDGKIIKAPSFEVIRPATIAGFSNNKTTVKVGKKITLRTIEENNGDTKIKSVKWTRSNKKVTLKPNSKKRTITGKKKGKVIIKAVVTFKNGKKQTLKRTVTVKKK